MDEELRQLERVANPEDPSSMLRLFKARQEAGREITEESLLSVLPDLRIRTGLLAVINHREDSFSRFLAQLPQQTQAARELHDHYQWLRQDDVPPPAAETALERLSSHLRTHPVHRDAIRAMRQPEVQMEPVFEPGQEGAGFRRLVKTIDDHRRKGRPDTYVNPDLQTRWGMPRQVRQNQGRIVGWRVVVSEGQTSLPPESNPWAGQQLGHQVSEWQRTIGLPQNLHLPTKERYAVSQMVELHRSGGNSGIDIQGWSILEDPTQEPGSLVPGGIWDDDGRVYFGGDHPEGQYGDSRLRPSVVVDLQP